MCYTYIIRVNKMKRKRIVFLFIIGLLFFAGCGSKKELDYKVEILSFYYSYENNGESCTFTITKENNVIKYNSYGNITSCNNNINNLDNSYLEQLETIVKDNKLDNWDNFKEQNEEASSNNNYSIQIGYSDGKNIFSYGYDKFPENYNIVKQKLITFFKSIK